MQNSKLMVEFQEKYKEPLHEIFEKYQMDKGVCVAILVAWHDNLNKTDKLYTYDFAGSEKVDLVELGKDIDVLRLNLLIPPKM